MRIFTGESEDHKEYRRWKLWLSNKLLTLDKLPKEAYASYIFTCLGGKALETVEHLEADKYQREGGEKVLWDLLDKRFPEKEKSDELAEVLSEVFSLRAKEGESLRTWISRSTELFLKCERLTGVNFPSEARGWMVLKWSGLSEEQQAVVKGRSLGVMKLETISQSMRSVYPDFVVRKRAGVAMVEDEPPQVREDAAGASDEVQGFEDIELFLADFVPTEPETSELFEEGEVAEVLATTWKEKRAEITKLQRQRRFSDAKELKKSFRVEIEELKRKSKCNRCGKPGHWARECRAKPDSLPRSGKPGSSGANVSSAKETGAGLVEALSTTAVDDEIHFIASVGALNDDQPDEVLLVSSPGFGVLDSGCGKTIIGEATLAMFLDRWKGLGLPPPTEHAVTNQFRFGNGQLETSHRLLDLPVGLQGRRGILQAAVVKGHAPLLVSRPALKKLGARIDFHQDMLHLFQGQVQMPLQVNSAGQYMVDVMQFPDGVLKRKPDSKPADAISNLDNSSLPHESHNLDSSPSPPDVNETLISTAVEPMSESRKLGGISKKQIRKLKHQVVKGLKPVGKKYAVAEIFCPPRLTPQVEKMGLRGLSLDLQQGWNLEDSKLQEWVIRELEMHPPELLLLCPPCTDAGGWFNLNKCYMSMQEYLARKLRLKRFLKFCKRLITNQLKTHGRFVFEHPAPSVVWKDPEMRAWCDELTSFVTDMCCFDLHVPAVNDSPKKLIKKSTRLLVSHSDMKEYLAFRCPGSDHHEHREHATIAGHHSSVGSVSKHAGKYTPEFVQALLCSVPALRAHEVLPLDGPIHDVSAVHEVLVAEEESATDEELTQVITRLHKNLGHPSQPELIRLLKHGQVSKRALELAGKFKCSLCESRKPPGVPNPAQVSQVTVFNHKIGIDVKNLTGWKVNQKIKALNIVDYASNFQLMIPFFEVETAALLRKLISDRWLAWAGNPRELVMDPARTNLGKALAEPCELEGTHINVTAAGAHWQLGKVEVHGGIFARLLEKVIDERSPSTQEEWLDCVRHCHVKNSTIQTHGYTPSQVVFGKNPDIPGALLDEPQKVIPCTAGLVEDSVEKAQAIRHAAKKALLELQDSKNMRRALAARPRVARTFRAGDIVAYWRDQKWAQGLLSRGGRWHGSAVVLGNIGKNVVIVHRTHVLRCAPEQLRLATYAERQLVETPETHLLGVKDMIEHGTFRSAQYVDLTSQSYPAVEADVMHQALSPDPSVPALPENESVVAPANRIIPQEPTIFDDPPSPDTAPAPDRTEVFSETPMDVEATPESPVEVDTELDQSAPASSSGVRASSAAVPPTEPTTYGPIRRKVPSKSGPLTLHRPAAMQHDDFVEVMQDVIPHMVEEAVNSLKREADDVGVGHVDKSARNLASEQLSVQHVTSSLSSSDAHELWEALQDGTAHETLIAQHIQKRLQKELPHSNNVPWLQAQVDAAKTLEWNTLSEKQAVRLLSPAEAAWVRKHKSHRIMGSRFVIVKKAVEDLIETGGTPDPENPTHWKVKARWCLQGHLDPDLSSKAREGALQSPTLSQMARMVLFQLLSSFKWTLQLGDIKGAFLEAGPLAERYRPLFAWLPPGGIPGTDSAQLVEVLGNVYGQNDAPSSWYRVFDEEVQKAGFTRSAFDACLYYLRDEQGRLCGLLGSHVDDTVTGGYGPMYDKALSYLRNRFPYRKWRVSEGEFCGCHYKQDPVTKEIVMSQKNFAVNLKPAHIPARRRCQRDAPLDSKEISVLRAINGSLNWLSSQSRPDLAAQTSLSQQAMAKPLVHHLCEVNNIIRRAKQHADLSIRFKPISPDRLALVCHSDAAFANVGVYTQAGYVIGFTDSSLDDGNSTDWTPAVWKSHRLPRAVGSTLSAEAQSMASASGTLEWTSLLLLEAMKGSFEVRDFVSRLPVLRTMVVTDCKSLYDHPVSVSAPTAVEDRRTSIDVVIIRQSLQRTKASVRWVPTNRMLADSLTKDAGDPTDLLRACIRDSKYQISPEETVLQMQALEKQRRKNLKNPQTE